jgi:hypothetical protein
MDLSAANELKIKDDALRVGAVYWRIEDEKIALDKALKAAQYTTTEMDKKF